MYDDYTVETKMWMSEGKQPRSSPLKIPQQPPQPNYPLPDLQRTVSAPDTNPAGYVSPSRVPKTYPQEVAEQPFNGSPAVYRSPERTTTVTTRVVDPPRHRAVLAPAQSVTYVQQPVAVTSPSRQVTYNFNTFDPHRVPTYTFGQ
jgi:hypothetical protein